MTSEGFPPAAGRKTRAARFLAAAVIAFVAASLLPFGPAEAARSPSDRADRADAAAHEHHVFGRSPEEARKDCDDHAKDALGGVDADRKEAMVRLCAHYLGSGGGDQYSLLPLYRWQSWSSAVPTNKCGGFLGIPDVTCSALNFIVSLEHAAASFLWAAASSIMRLGLGGGIYNNFLVDWLYDRSTRALFDNGLVFVVWGLLALVFAWRVLGFGRPADDRSSPQERTKAAFRDLGFGLLMILIMWLAYEPREKDPAAPVDYDAEVSPSALQSERESICGRVLSDAAASAGEDPFRRHLEKDTGDVDGDMDTQESLSKACRDVRAKGQREQNARHDTDQPAASVSPGQSVPTSLRMTDIAEAVSSWAGWVGDVVTREIADMSVSLRTDGSFESFHPTCSEYVGAMRRTSGLLRAAEGSGRISAMGTGGMEAVSALWEAAFLPPWMEAEYGETRAGVAMASWCHVMESRNEISPDVQAELGRAAGYPSLEPCSSVYNGYRKLYPDGTGPRVYEVNRVAGCPPEGRVSEKRGPGSELRFLLGPTFNPNADGDDRFVNSRSGELPEGMRGLSSRWGNSLTSDIDNGQRELAVEIPVGADSKKKDAWLPTGLSRNGFLMCDGGSRREDCQRGPYTRDMSDEEQGITTFMWDACVWDPQYESFRPQVSWAWATDLHASQCEMWWHLGTLPGPKWSGSVYEMRSLDEARNTEFLRMGRKWADVDLFDEHVPWGAGDNYLLDGVVCPEENKPAKEYCTPAGPPEELSLPPAEGAADDAKTSSCVDQPGNCDPRKTLEIADRVAGRTDEFRTYMESLALHPLWRGHLNKTQVYLSVPELAARSDLSGRMTPLSDVGNLLETGTSNGSVGGSMGAVFVGFVTLVTAFFYGLMLAGMGVGLIIAKFGALLLLSLSPFMLLVMAMPFGRAKEFGYKYFKTLVGYLIADVLIMMMLGFVIVILGLLTMVISWVSDSSWTLVFAPLIAMFVTWRISKKLGLGVNPFSMRGSMGLAAGAAGAFRANPSLLSREGLRSAEGRRALTEGIAEKMREGPHPRVTAGAERVRTAALVGAKRTGAAAMSRTGDLTSKLRSGKWMESDSKAKRMLSKGWSSAVGSPSRVGSFLSSSADKDLEKWRAWKQDHDRRMAQRRAGQGSPMEERARAAGRSAVHRVVDKVDARRARLELDPDRRPVVSGVLARGLRSMVPPPDWTDKDLESFRARAAPDGISDGPDVTVRAAAAYAAAAGPRMLSRIDRRREHVSESADPSELRRLDSARSQVQDVMARSRDALRRIDPMADSAARLDELAAATGSTEVVDAVDSVVERSSEQTRDRLLSKSLASDAAVYSKVMGNPHVGPQAREGLEKMLASSGMVPGDGPESMLENARALFPFVGVLMRDGHSTEELAALLRSARSDPAALDAYYRRSVYEDALSRSHGAMVTENGVERRMTGHEMREAANRAATEAVGYVAAGLEDVHRKFADSMADRAAEMSFSTDMAAVRSMLGVAEANAVEGYLSDFLSDSSPAGRARMAQRMAMHEDLKDMLSGHLRQSMRQAELSSDRAEELSREVVRSLQKIPMAAQDVAEEVMRRLDGISQRHEELRSLGPDGLRHMIASLDTVAALSAMERSAQPVLTVDAYLRYLASVRSQS